MLAKLDVVLPCCYWFTRAIPVTWRTCPKDNETATSASVDRRKTKFGSPDVPDHVYIFPLKGALHVLADVVSRVGGSARFLTLVCQTAQPSAGMKPARKFRLQISSAWSCLRRQVPHVNGHGDPERISFWKGLLQKLQ